MLQRVPWHRPDQMIVNKIRGWTRPPYFTTDSTTCGCSGSRLHPGGLAALDTRGGPGPPGRSPACSAACLPCRPRTTPETIIKESPDFRLSWQMKISIIDYYPDNYTIYRQPRGRNEWGSWQIDTRHHYHLIF